MKLFNHHNPFNFSLIFFDILDRTMIFKLNKIYLILYNKIIFGLMRLNSTLIGSSKNCNKSCI